MKKYIHKDDVRRWVALIEDGQTDEALSLMQAEVELVRKEKLTVRELELKPVPEADVVIDADEAKRKLKHLGLSYRGVAPQLGVTYQHLCLVLNGHRQSRRLLRKIEELPQSEIMEVAK